MGSPGIPPLFVGQSERQQAARRERARRELERRRRQPPRVTVPQPTLGQGQERRSIPQDFAAGVPIGLAQGLGAPVDLASLLNPLLVPGSGQVDVEPLGGSQQFVRGVGVLGLPTETQGVAGRVGQEIGAAALPLGLTKAFGPAGRITSRVLAKELGTAAATGAMASLAPKDSPFIEAALQLGTGLAIEAPGIAKALGRKANQSGGFVPPLRRPAIGQALKETIDTATAGRIDAAEVARTAEGIQERLGVTPTFGQASQSTSVQALERGLAQGSQDGKVLYGRIADAEREGQIAVARALQRVAIGNEGSATAGAADVQRSIQRTIASQERSVEQRLHRVKSRATSASDAADVVRDGLHLERRAYRAEVGAQFEPIRRSRVRFSMDSVNDFINAAGTSGTKAQKEYVDTFVPQSIRRAKRRATQNARQQTAPQLFDQFDRPIERPRPSAAFFQSEEAFDELHEFRQVLDDEYRQLKSEGKNRLARENRELHGLVEASIDAPLVPQDMNPDTAQELVDGFRQAEKGWRFGVELYDQSIVGDFLHKTRKGANQFTEFQLAKKALQPGEVGRGNARALIRALSPETQDVQRLTRAHGARGQLREAVASEIFENIADGDGQIRSGAALNRWLDQHQPFLDELQKGGINLSDEYRDLASAQRQLDLFHTAQRRNWRNAELSVASFFLGDDAQTAVRRVMGSQDAVRGMRGLRGLVQNDPVALTGLRRAVVEEVLSQGGGVDTLTPHKLSDALDNTRTRALLGELFTPEEMAQIDQVVADGQVVLQQVLRGGPNATLDVGATRALRLMPIVWSRIFAVERDVVSAQYVGVETIARNTARMLSALSANRARKLMTDALSNPAVMAAMMEEGIPDVQRSKAIRAYLINLGGNARGQQEEPTE